MAMALSKLKMFCRHCIERRAIVYSSLLQAAHRNSWLSLRSLPEGWGRSLCTLYGGASLACPLTPEQPEAAKTNPEGGIKVRKIQLGSVSWLGVLTLILVLATVSSATADSSKSKTAKPAAQATKAVGAAVDINNATEQQLEDLPGVGKSTAGKIIAGRPYSSVDDLAKAGVSKTTIAKIAPLVTVGSARAAAKAETAAPVAKRAESAVKTQAKAAAPSGPVDINSATEQQLEDLPGVGKATAGKIIGGRPYSSVDDLAKAGVPKTTIAKIAPLVVVGGARVAAKAEVAAPVAKQTESAVKTQAKAAAASGPVDINNATEKQLEDLPGVGKATAAKIIGGRPYSSVDDLAKSGVPKSTIAKIAPLVMVGGAPAAARAAVAAPIAKTAEPAVATPARTAPAAVTAPPATPTAYTAPPVAGMVWVNLDSKVYHKEGDRWYGKTKNGKYMSEADAVAAGYRASREKVKP